MEGFSRRRVAGRDGRVRRGQGSRAGTNADGGGRAAEGCLPSDVGARSHDTARIGHDVSEDVTNAPAGASRKSQPSPCHKAQPQSTATTCRTHSIPHLTEVTEAVQLDLSGSRAPVTFSFLCLSMWPSIGPIHTPARIPACVFCPGDLRSRDDSQHAGAALFSSLACNISRP